MLKWDGTEIVSMGCSIEMCCKQYDSSVLCACVTLHSVVEALVPISCSLEMEPLGE